LQGEQTPLHLACELDAKECVLTLLAAKAKVGVEDGQLRTPLLLACESRAFECVQALIDADAPLGARDKNDMTPLHWLAAHGAAEPLLHLAIKKGADVNAVNYQFQSPLWYAVTKGNFAAATLLIGSGASLTIDDESKATMMHLAMQHAAGGSVEEAKSADDTLALLHTLLKASVQVRAHPSRCTPIGARRARRMAAPPCLG
jgi:ankyrin repeat protein